MIQLIWAAGTAMSLCVSVIPDVWAESKTHTRIMSLIQWNRQETKVSACVQADWHVYGIALGMKHKNKHYHRNAWAQSICPCDKSLMESVEIKITFLLLAFKDMQFVQRWGSCLPNLFCLHLMKIRFYRYVHTVVRLANKVAGNQKRWQHWAW